MKNMYKYINGVFASILGVLSPIEPIVISLTFIIILDFIFGICKSIKLKEEITSRKMSATLPKLLLYNLSIIGAYLVNIYVFETGVALEKVVAGLIITIEAKSIDEHFRAIFKFSIWDKMIAGIERGKSITKINK